MVQLVLRVLMIKNERTILPPGFVKKFINSTYMLLLMMSVKSKIHELVKDTANKIILLLILLESTTVIILLWL